MRIKVSIYNTVCAMLLQVVNLVVNLILPRVLVDVYGSSVNGLVSSVRQFIGYFSIVEAGLAGAAVYALYKPLATKETESINGILSAANRFYNISGFIFSALVLVSTFIYPLFVSGQGIDPLTIALLVVIIGASGSLEFFAIGKYRVLLTADQKSYVISIINAVAIALNSVIILVMAKLAFDIVMVQLVALLSFFLRSVLYTLYCRKRYAFINYKAKPDNKALDKRWDSLILQILGVVTTGTPILVITFFNGLKEVSVYTIFNMVFASVLALLSTFNNGLSAVFGDLLVRNETAIMQKAYKQYEFLYYALLGWGYACMAILIMPFIKIYTVTFTDANYVRPEIAVLFVAIGLLYNIKTPQGMLVISAGLYKETKIQTLTQAIINVVASVALAPFFGMAGVLMGSVLSNLYRDIDLIQFVPKTVTKLPIRATVIRVVRMLILFALTVAPFILLIDIKAASLVEWVLWAIPVAIWAFIVFTVGNILMERSTTREILQRLKLLLKKA